MKPLITIAQAEEILSAHMPLAPSEKVPLHEACGRILMQDIVADRPIPPYPRVMMDGIAIDSNEFHGIGTEFQIVGTQAAGTPALQKTESQTCFEVMTGAVLPNGCDCVIPVEEISVTADSVILSPDAITDTGTFIHPMGSDSKSGEVLITKHTKLGPTELAIAASVGATHVQVAKLPLITVVTSGDEVIPPEQTPSAFQIRRSHASAILSTLRSSQLATCETIHLPDNESVTRDELKKRIVQSDFLILTGGVSMGKFDFIAPILTELLGEPLFHGIKQKPGKPFGLWKKQTSEKVTLAFALPGNPVSVMATLTRYILPALKLHQQRAQEKQTRTLDQDFHWKARIPGFAPCCITSSGQLRLQTMRNSGDYLALKNCDGFVELEVPDTIYKAGTPLSFYHLLPIS